MFLSATTQSLELDLNAAVSTTQLPVVVSYVDISQSTFAMSAATTATTASNSTTAVTIVAAPGATTTRQIKEITIKNSDTAAVLLWVQLNDNSTLREITKCTLSVGDTLQYTDTGGWKTLDSNGSAKFSINNVTGNLTVGGTLGVTGALSVTGVITPSQTNGIVGTTTNNDANAGSVGEVIESYVGATSAPTSTQFGDLTSIALTAGDWDIVIMAEGLLATGTGLTRMQVGIGTASGNNGAGCVAGDTLADGSLPTVDFNQNYNITSKRVSLSGSATYYLKMYAQYSGGTPQFRGRITARRRR